MTTAAIITVRLDRSVRTDATNGSGWKRNAHRRTEQVEARSPMVSEQMGGGRGIWSSKRWRRAEAM